MARRVIRIAPERTDTEALRVLWVREFSEGATQSFARDLAQLRLEKQPVCPIVIDSPGGDVYSLFAMMDLLDAYDGGPIVTMALGKTMSCGAALFTCGATGHRFIAPNATMMLHDVASEGGEGKVEDQRASVKETQRLNDLIWKRMSKNIGKPPSFLLNQLKKRARVDWFVTPREAVKLGLADHIGLPMFEVKMTFDPFLGVPAGGY